MTKFHEGQEVEVAWMRSREYGKEVPVWRKAKIVSVDKHGGGYAQVQFHDSTRAVFDSEHIRPRALS